MSFLEQIATKTDIVATDYVSQLLREKIETLKENKRSVLILDDFDRIDPEHTFRILNVLSAHIDGDEENKFGFDHIIIVGDIENLRNIFHHKYGDKTDFWGYFDKFFTVEPYPFNNEQAIAERIPYLIPYIKYEDAELEGAIGQPGIINSLLEEVLKDALAVKTMNLRQLYKPIHHSFLELRKGVLARKFHFGQQGYRLKLCIDIGIKLLVAIYGTKYDFLQALMKIRANSSDIPVQGMGYRYTWLANPMLKSMIPFKDGGHNKWTWLDKYTLVAINEDLDNSGHQGIGLEGEAHARFFYDTLYEYVKRSEYKK